MKTRADILRPVGDSDVLIVGAGVIGVGIGQAGMCDLCVL
jgi:hypothetical protein